MQVPFVISRGHALPLQRQIYEEWRGGILAGRFRHGERVPSTRDLAAALGVSRATVTAAYDQLLAEGYFQSARGAGTFVSRDLPDDSLRVRGGARQAAGDATGVRLSRYASRLDAPFQRPRAMPPGVIDLSQPPADFDHVPFALWRRLLLRHMRHATPAVLGHADQVAGYEPLRREIARYLTRARAVRCDPSQVVVVNGSQQALDLCARVLVDPGDRIALEDPGYHGARQLFAAHGARVSAARVGDAGIDVGALPASARLVYVTPSHQFPTGVSMSLARRLELLEWARPRNTVIVEDDYDSEYRYSGAPLPALQGLARDVPVIYVGTFSNVMFPGLRIGYLVLPPALVDAVTRAKWHADRHTPMLEQAALADFMREGHLERHVRRTRRLYKRRRDALVDALHRRFGDRARIRGDAAGMHLVATLPLGGPAEAGPDAPARGVRIASTAPYYVKDAPADEYIIRFSALRERALVEGVRRL